jgi:sugar lactone lactonase YvrE
MARTRVCVAGLFIASLAAGCGGGGSTSSSVPRTIAPSMAPGSGGSPSSTATATFIITWPNNSGSSTVDVVRRAHALRAFGSRHRQYISPSTASITIAVNGGTPTTVENPNIGAGTTATNTPTTTVTLPAQPGVNTFAVDDFDTSSNLLASNTIAYNIVAGQVNNVPITLNGNLAKVACMAIAPFVTGTAPTFAQVGVAGQLSILPEDADGNIIFAPGAVPQISLTGPTPNSAATTTTPNLYVTTPQTVGTAVAYTATGTNLAGTTVTTTCNVTRQLAMYVANHTADTLYAGTSSTSVGSSVGTITIYPASATGSATPTATIAGANTQLNAVYFPVVDAKGDLFVSNQGPLPGSAFSIKAGYVSIFAPAASGNVAPMSSIPNLGEPQGLAFDPSGTLYVSEVDRIEEYPASANGVTAAAVPSNTITGSATDLGCYGLALDANLGIYLACANAMLYFPPKSTGNQTPGIIGALGTVVAAGMTVPTTQSWNGVAVDASGNFALPGFNPNIDAVSIYSASDIPTPNGAYSTPVPTLSKDVDYNQPFGIAVDQNGQYYVTDFGNSTIEVFSSLTVMETGLGTNLTLTGLNKPYGITVR